MVYMYNYFRLYLWFLLFVICLEVFVWWQNLIIFHKLKDEPWQRVMHAYYESWHIFMVLYFEMLSYHGLKRMEEDRGRL